MAIFQFTLGRLIWAISLVAVAAASAKLTALDPTQRVWCVIVLLSFAYGAIRGCHMVVRLAICWGVFFAVYLALALLVALRE